ncbi:MAG: hypothetical protein WCH83_13975, partial [Alphaproteobacteria bacterium]
MSFLSRFRITVKLMALVAILNVIIITIAAVGVQGITTVTNDSTRAALAGERAAVSARINQRVTALSRAEFIIANDVSAENVRQQLGEIDEALSDIPGFVAIIRASDAPEVQAALAKVTQAISAYQAMLKVTVDRARALSAQPTEADRQALLASASASRPAFRTARAAVRDQTDLLIARAKKFAADAEATSAKFFRQSIVISTIGLLLGTGLGIAMAR